MLSFRVIVVVDGERTIQVVQPFEHVPSPGTQIHVPRADSPVIVRHVIEAERDGIAGIVLGWTG